MDVPNNNNLPPPPPPAPMASLTSPPLSSPPTPAVLSPPLAPAPTPVPNATVFRNPSFMLTQPATPPPPPPASVTVMNPLSPRSSLRGEDPSVGIGVTASDDPVNEPISQINPMNATNAAPPPPPPPHLPSGTSFRNPMPQAENSQTDMPTLPPPLPSGDSSYLPPAVPNPSSVADFSTLQQGNGQSHAYYSPPPAISHRPSASYFNAPAPPHPCMHAPNGVAPPPLPDGGMSGSGLRPLVLPNTLTPHYNAQGFQYPDVPHADQGIELPPLGSQPPGMPISPGVPGYPFAYGPPQTPWTPYGSVGGFDMQDAMYDPFAFGDDFPFPATPAPTGAQRYDFGMDNPLRVARGNEAAPDPRPKALQTPAAVRYAEREALNEKFGKEAAPPSQQEGTRRPPWKPASLTIASAFQDDHHPRWVDDKGRKRLYSICGARLGRYWCQGCRICDPFCESVVSDIAAFGPGISSYFKTLKALAWVFVAMTLLAIPSLGLNVFGRKSHPGIQDVGLFESTLGNIGAESNQTSLYIPFTDCTASLPSGETVALPCPVAKTFAAFLYSCADAGGILLLLITYLWIRISSKKDARLVSTAVLSAEKFTVMLSRIPAAATESMIKDHMFKATGHKIADVTVAEDENHLIGLFMTRGRLVKRLEGVENAIWKYTTLNKENTLKKFRRQRDVLVKRIRAINDQQKKVPKGRGALVAFVTFEEEAGVKRALEMFPSSFFRRLFMPKGVQLHAPDGKYYRLAAEHAPSPSVILWENLGVSKGSRYLRRTVTFMWSLILLAVSCGFIYWASIKAEEFVESQKPQNCPAVVTAAQAAVDENLAKCYCSKLSATDAIAAPLCVSWLSTQGYALAIQNVASMVVAFINMLLQAALTELTAFEKHHSLDKMQISLAIRLFIAMFINTALLSLILRADIPFLPGSSIRYQDFDPAWYSTVGSGIIITLLVNIVSPHISSIFYFCRIRCYNWCRGAHGARSQRDLNMRVIGPEFRLSTRYAQLMNTIASTLLYSTGVPLLLPIAALQIFVTFWVDKWLFLRFYRTPPRLGITLGKTMLELIPIAVILHSAFGFWMLTNPSIFASNKVDVSEISSTADNLKLPFASRLQQLSTVPLVLLLGAMIALTFLRGLLSAVLSLLLKACVLLTCGRFRLECSTTSRKARRSNAPPVTFSTLKEQRKIQGIPSYNILMNPRFAQAFAISKTFAQKHKRVSDIFNDDGTDVRSKLENDLGGLSMRVLPIK